MNSLRAVPTRTISIPRVRVSTIHPRRFAQTQTKPVKSTIPAKSTKPIKPTKPIEPTKPTEPTSTSTSASPPKQPPKSRRFRARRIFYGLVFVGGAGAGFLVRDFASPTPWPAPGTIEDDLYLKACAKELEDLDVVKFMRSQCVPPPDDDAQDSTPVPSSIPVPDTPTGTDSQIPVETLPKVWIELDIAKNVVESAHDSHAETRTATFESMAGIRGLGVQRAFLNTETKELVAVVWIGKSLGGWPGLAHGGAIATVFQDCMARMIAGPATSIDSTPAPTSLKMTYAKKTRSHAFYIIRAHYSTPQTTSHSEPSVIEPVRASSSSWSAWLPSWEKVTEKIHAAAGAKETVEILGTMEDVNGDLLVAAKGTFTVV